MSTPTLADVVARQGELAKMIAQLHASAASVDLSVILAISAVDIQLQPGEHYAGTVLDDDGQVKHHLVKMAQTPATRLNWQAAKDWAEAIGGSLPTRQEQALLFANCKQHMKPEWHWSSQEHEDDASYAWVCRFYYGVQLHDRKGYEGCAVAVRRLSPSILQSA